MQIFIFLVEIIIIAFLLDVDMMGLKQGQPQEEYFSCYTTLNAQGENILFLSEVPSEQKFAAWQSSTLKEEMLLQFPHIDRMSNIIEHNIIGDEAFKHRLIEYIENVHGQYLAQELSYDEFKRALTHPDPNLPPF